jgi:hypothetical protein
MRKLGYCCALVMILAGSGNLLAANLVLNPGFESLYDNWAFAGQGGDQAGLHGGVFNSGSYSAYLSCPLSCNGSASSSVSQTISTIIGATYAIDFALSPPSCCLAFAFQGGVYVDFGATNLFTTTQNDWVGTFSNYHYEVVASNTATDFSFRAEGLATGAMFIDDISVVNLSQDTGTPEPSTWITMGGALAGVFAIRRRRKAGSLRLSA